MTKKEAFDDINNTQKFYVDKLIEKLNNITNNYIKHINFTSPTGTGKTMMMSMLINRLPDFYFIITTLSKGQLHIQIRDNLMKTCKSNNFYVYGSADYKINSILQADDILQKIPEKIKCIWLRDEGHIHTNRFEELLTDRCYAIVNFSATNLYSDILCNFTHTMMLRTVNQIIGTPEDAVHKLLYIKKIHENVRGYNPCGIFRCVGDKADIIYNRIVTACEQNGLKYIDIISESHNIQELCEDDNEYDVIINKFKIVEGIDIRRAHVLYMDNQPSNPATSIQVIGRCRRNALLYRNDVDILSSENAELLKETRQCYVFYNVKDMHIDTDDVGELQYVFCDHISCEMLLPGSHIEVQNGQLSNGLYVIELEGETGKFDVIKDESTGFNVISPQTSFYNLEHKIEYIEIECEYFNDSKSCNVKVVKADILMSYPIQNIKGELYYIVSKYEWSHLIEQSITITVEDWRDLKHISRLKYLGHDTYGIKKSYCDSLISLSSNKIYNDRESAIVGTDLMKYIKGIGWIESKAVTSKMNRFCKFNQYITKIYADELSYGKNQIFTGHNSFPLDKKCNSMLGYCVEYYSKWFLYGDSYLEHFLYDARRESHSHYMNDIIVIRACMLKYKDMMIQSFGTHIAKVIPTASYDKLKFDYTNFCELVITLGLKTAMYVKQELYPDTVPVANIDPCLSINHITGLADYITKDTILDVKVRNNIDEVCIKQVLAYHYLSTKRLDLNIKRVIVYDAVSGKSVIIPIGKEPDMIKIATHIYDIKSYNIMMKCGINAHISKINYETFEWYLYGSTIIVDFENGACGKGSIYDFRNGNIESDHKCIEGLCIENLGQIKRMKNGMMAQMISYNPIDVMFEDGRIITDCNIFDFINGTIKYPYELTGLHEIKNDEKNDEYVFECACGNILRINRSEFENHHICSCGCGCYNYGSLIGMTKTMNSGLEGIVIRDKGKNVNIMFENGVIKQNVTKSYFKSGKLSGKIHTPQNDKQTYMKPNVIHSIWKYDKSEK